MGVLLSAEASTWGISSGRNWDISSHAQLLRCRGRREQVVGLTQGWDVSGGWGKQGSRSLLGIARMLLKCLIPEPKKHEDESES